MNARAVILAPVIFAVFAALLVAAVVTEVFGRMRAGKSFEPGDGLGSPEDFA